MGSKLTSVANASPLEGLLANEWDKERKEEEEASWVSTTFLVFKGSFCRKKCHFQPLQKEE